MPDDLWWYKKVTSKCDKSTMNKIFTLFIYIFSLTFIGCADNNNLGERSDTSLVNSPKDGIDLIGEWTICRTQSGSGDSIVTINANVCTIVNFNMDNTVIVTIPSGDKQYFRWIANKNDITLINTRQTNKGNAYFEDGKYEMLFTKVKKNIELKLILTAKSYTYILVRSYPIARKCFPCENNNENIKI